MSLTDKHYICTGTLKKRVCEFSKEQAKHYKALSMRYTSMYEP